MKSWKLCLNRALALLLAAQMLLAPMAQGAQALGEFAPEEEIEAMLPGEENAANGNEEDSAAEPGEEAPPAEPGEEAPPAEPGEEAPPAEPGEEAPPAEPGEEAPPAEPGEEAPPAEEGELNSLGEGVAEPLALGGVGGFYAYANYPAGILRSVTYDSPVLELVDQIYAPEIGKVQPYTELDLLGYKFRTYFKNELLNGQSVGISKIIEFTDEVLYLPEPRVPNYEFVGWYLYKSEPFTQSELGAEGVWGQPSAALLNRFESGDFDFYDDAERILIAAHGGDTSYGTYHADMRLWSFDAADMAALSNLVDAAYLTSMGGHLPLFAVWEKSANATLTDLSVRESGGGTLELLHYEESYETAIPGTLAAVSAAEKGFTSDKTEYFARIGQNTASIAFELEVYEPESTIEVTYAFGGGEPAVRECALGGGVTHPHGYDEITRTYSPTNGAVDLEELLEAANTDVEEARARYSYLSIPIQSAQGTGKLSNTITIAVTAPGGATKSYVLYIQRLADPTLSLNPGNTPAGMIRRDTNPLWTEALKNQTIDSFFNGALADRSFYKQADSSSAYDYINNRPSSDENHGGSLYGGRYYPAAQVTSGAATVDLDTSEKAIVVYLNDKFTDPGLSVVDATGRPASVGAGLVTRKLVLEQAEDSAFSWDLLLESAQTEEYLIPDIAVSTVGGKDEIDLTDLGIRPGVYYMEYTYQDPYLNKAFTADASGFVAPNAEDKAETYRRPVVVLPIPGDVDMDGAVTMLDALALRDLLARKSEIDSDLWTLYMLRVCDVDGSGAADEGDVDTLLENYFPRIIARTKTEYFYLPLPGQNAPTARGNFALETADENKVQLSLHYLGATDTREADGLPNTIPAAREVDIENPSSASTGDIVWLGIYVENAEVLSSAVRGMELRLTYNGEYLRPAFYELGATDVTGWRTKLEAANTGFSATFGASYRYTGSQPLLTLRASADRAIHEGIVESNIDMFEMSIVVTADAEQALQSLDDGYLLRVPFVMLRHAEDTENFVLPSVSMRALSLRDAADGRFAADGRKTAIYGKKTTNFLNKFQFIEIDKIITGEDKTEATVLPNSARTDRKTIYGELFYYRISRYEGVRLDGGRGELPKGLSVVDNYQGFGETYIVGTPEESGVFRFYVEGEAYAIEVEKAPLHVTIDGGSRAYGEPDPTLTFSFDPTDVKPIDQEKYSAGTLTGSSTNLAVLKLGLDGETHPDTVHEKLYITSSGDLLTNDESKDITARASAAGAYYTKIYGLVLPNYRIVYQRESIGEESASFGDNLFTVMKRPIQIEKFDSEKSVGYVYNADGMSMISLKNVVSSATGGGTDNAFTAKLPDNTYQNTDPILSGDMLELKYEVTIEVINEGNQIFAFPFADEDCVAEGEISFKDGQYSIEILKTGAFENYALYGGGKSRIEDPTVKVTVRQRTIQSLVVPQLPKEIREGPFYHGDQLSLGSVNFSMTFEPDKLVDGNVESVAWKGISGGYSVEKWGEENNVWAGWSKLRVNEQGAPILDENGKKQYDYLGDTGDYEEFTQPIQLDRYLHTVLNGPLYLTICTTTHDRDADGRLLPESRPLRYVVEQYPIKVQQRVLRVRVDGGARYYGEKNPEHIISFEPAWSPSSGSGNARSYGLAAGDLERWNASGRTPTVANLAEFLSVPGNLMVEPTYATSSEPPSFYALSPPTSENPPEQLAKNQDVGDYHVLLFGGGSHNYQFEYACIENNEITYDAKMGYSGFTIAKRPIYIKEMMATPDFVYDITYDKQDYIRNDQKATFGGAAAGGGSAAAKNEFTAGVPWSGDTENEYFFEYNPSATDGYTNIGNAPTYPLTGSAIYYDTAAGTYDTVVLDYTGTFLPKDTENRPTDLDHYYYSLTEESQQVDVEVSNVRLGVASGDNRNKNYLLIYDREARAQDRQSTDSIMKNAGTVKLRQIRGIVVTQDPEKMLYEFGDPLILSEIRFSIYYENHNPSVTHALGEECDCPHWVRSCEAGNLDMPPQDNDIRIVWYEGSELLPPAERASVRSHLLVPMDSGRYLSVLGKRYLNMPEVENEAAAVEGRSLEPVRVNRGNLTLTIDSKERFYGEDITEYTMSLDLRNLSDIDKKKLLDAELITSLETPGTHRITAGSLGELLESEIIRLINNGEMPDGWSLMALDDEGQPVNPRSNVTNNAGYALSLAEDTDLDNYGIVVIPGAIKIYRRPILIDSILEVKENGERVPLDTIYVTSSDPTRRPINISATGGAAAGSNAFAHRVEANNIAPVDADGNRLNYNLPLTAGLGGIQAGDTVRLEIDMIFHMANANAGDAASRWGIPAGETGAFVRTSFENLVLSTLGGEHDNKNYIITAGQPNTPPVGETTHSGYVDRRQIVSIELANSGITEYAYGADGLDLNSFVVNVTYDNGTTGQLRGDSSYFTVMFWELGRAYPTKAEDMAGWADTLAANSNRKATNGQRLTVVPHSDNAIGHHGQYLLFSAREHEGQAFRALPVRTQTTIVVDQKVLSGSAVVTPQDKVYDGTIGAAGSIQLSGVYAQGGDFDQVYVPTQSTAGYSSMSSSQIDAALKNLIDGNQPYLFSATEAYSNGQAGMRLQFPVSGNGNVAYAETAEEKNDIIKQTFTELAQQQVTTVGITLAGRDAGNYKIASSLAPETAKALIKPASHSNEHLTSLRATTIALQTNVRSNAITVTTPGKTAQGNFSNANDKKNDQLQFIYHLQYFDEASSAFVYLYFDEASGTFQTTTEDDLGKSKGLYQTNVFGDQWVAGHEFDEHDPYAQLLGELPRDRYYRAGVSLGRTENYLGTDIAWSVGSVSAFQAEKSELDGLIAAEIASFLDLESSQKENDPVPASRTAGPVAKTYPYRITMLSTEWDDEFEENLLRRERTVFTELPKYRKKLHLELVTENVGSASFANVYWDAAKKTAVNVEKPELGKLVDAPEEPEPSTPEESGTRALPAGKAFEPLELDYLPMTMEPLYKEIQRQTGKTEYEEDYQWINEHNNLVFYVDYVRPSNPMDVTAAGIVIEQGDLTVHLGAEEVQLSILWKPSYAKPTTVTWTSSDPTIASVDADGILRFHSVGIVTITAVEAGGKKDSITVTVLQKRVVPMADTLFYFENNVLVLLDSNFLFYPDKGMTRGDAAILLYQFFVPGAEYLTGEAVAFSDLSTADRCYTAVQTLSAAGVVRGLDGGTFGGLQMVTRAEFATMLYRMLTTDLPGARGEYFADVSKETTWAVDYINSLAEMQMLHGTEAGLFLPARGITRAEAVTMLARVMQSGGYQLELDNAVMPSDVPESHWAYSDVMYALYATAPRREDEEET